MPSTFTRIRRGAVMLALVGMASVLGYRIIGGYGWLEAIWMVVITVSTVGYGERSDQTPEMQLLSIAVILLGVSASIYAIGGFLQMLLEGEVDRALGKRRMTKEIEKLKDHVIICGFGRLGSDLANQLKHRKVPFLVIDINPEKTVRANDELGLLAVTGDATEDSVLREANIATAKALVAALPSDAENVFITLTARNLRDDIQILSKSERETSCRKLRQAGVNKIVMPHQVGAQHIERMISRPSTADLVELFAEASHLDMELDEFQITRNSSMAGKTLADSGIKPNFNLLVVGIKNGDGDFTFNPPPSSEITLNDTLIVMGQSKNIRALKSSLKL